MAQKVTSKMQVCCCGCVGIAKGVGGLKWWEEDVIEAEKRYNGKTGAGTTDTIQ